MGRGGDDHEESDCGGRDRTSTRNRPEAVAADDWTAPIQEVYRDLDRLDAVGGLIWLASTIVMSLWTLRFGVALVRSDDSHVQLTEARTRRRRASH